MDSDDEAPPELVQTGAVPVETHEVTVKVPITIVTGMAKVSNFWHDIDIGQGISVLGKLHCSTIS
jgi:hypothetical protein